MVITDDALLTIAAHLSSQMMQVDIAKERIILDSDGAHGYVTSRFETALEYLREFIAMENDAEQPVSGNANRATMEMFGPDDD